jgi:hypothetical protein
MNGEAERYTNGRVAKCKCEGAVKLAEERLEGT